LLVAMDRVLTWVHEETRILSKKKKERRLGEYQEEYAGSAAETREGTKPLAIRNLPRWVTAGCHGFSITNRRNCSVCAIRKRTAGSTPFRIFFVLVDRACVNDLS